MDGRCVRASGADATARIFGRTVVARLAFKKDLRLHGKNDDTPGKSFFGMSLLIYPVTAQPASTRTTSPVIGNDSSLNRKHATRATSSASIKSPLSGCFCFINSTMAGFDCALALMGVRTS